MRGVPDGHSVRRASNAELIHRSLEGDPGASRELHRGLAPIATAFLRKLGVRDDEIEDARQDVFLQFFRYLASFRGEADLKTWLFRLCVTEARRARQRRKVSGALATLLRRQPANDAVPPASHSDATLQRLIKEALDRMEPDQRQAFISFELDGLTGKEVAKKIGGLSVPATLRRRYEAQRVVQEILGIDTRRSE
jgi:RNA polymerase sigma-70 factor (ECF subfamily)